MERRGEEERGGESSLLKITAMIIFEEAESCCHSCS